MSERLIIDDPLRRVEEAVKKSLRDIEERSKNPGLLDRIKLPVNRLVTDTFVRLLNMTPDEIAKIRES